MQPITANRAASAIHTVTVALNPIAPTSNPKPNCFQKPGQAGLDSSTYKPKITRVPDHPGQVGLGPHAQSAAGAKRRGQENKQMATQSTHCGPRAKSRPLTE